MHEVSEQEQEEDNSFKGKLIAFFDPDKDPMVKAIKKRFAPKEEEKKEEWVYTR